MGTAEEATRLLETAKRNSRSSDSEIAWAWTMVARAARDWELHMGDWWHARNCQLLVEYAGRVEGDRRVS